MSSGSLFSLLFLAVPLLLFNNSRIGHKSLIMLEEIDCQIQHNSGEKINSADNSKNSRNTGSRLAVITGASLSLSLEKPG
jgi:hypothetical protein